MTKCELEHLGVKISKKLKDEVTKAIARGDYVSQSDLTRAAIRKILNEEKEA
jgi:Arc/MetJ-type ribon-helix-helix transcriptional regulator